MANAIVEEGRGFRSRVPRRPGYRLVRRPQRRPAQYLADSSLQIKGDQQIRNLRMARALYGETSVAEQGSRWVRVPGATHCRCCLTKGVSQWLNIQSCAQNKNHHRRTRQHSPHYHVWKVRGHRYRGDHNEMTLEAQRWA